MKYLKSRTVWTLVAIFVFNGLQAIQPEVSVELQSTVNVILSLLAAFFRVTPRA